MNESVNDEAVCRTAPATPGLLNIAPEYDNRGLKCAAMTLLMDLILSYEQQCHTGERLDSIQS